MRGFPILLSFLYALVCMQEIPWNGRAIYMHFAETKGEKSLGVSIGFVILLLSFAHSKPRWGTTEWIYISNISPMQSRSAGVAILALYQYWYGEVCFTILLQFRKLFATAQTQQPATNDSATTHAFAWDSQHKKSIQHVSTTYPLGYPGVSM